MRIRIVATLMLVLLAGPASAQQSAKPEASRDVLHTIEARKLLMDEPELAGHNIGVMVHNRVAYLWGPVVSAEIAFRAELCLRTMRDLAAVRSELFVSDLLENAKPLKIERPPTYLPDRVPPKLPIDPLRVPQVQAPEAKPAKAATIHVTARDASTPPMAQAEPLTVRERTLNAAVRSIVQSKAPYRDVQFAVQDGRVYLRTDHPDTSALHEVARAVARLPDVDGVIVLEKMR